MRGRWGLLLGLVLLPEVAFPQNEPEFRIYWLACHGRRQETILEDFNGDGRYDVINFTIDYYPNPPVRWALFYFQQPNGGFAVPPDALIPLDDRACVIAMGDFDGDKACDLAFLAADGLYHYPLVNGTISETPKKLLHTRTFFSVPSHYTIPVWQHRVDLDQNGYDDAIIPVHDGYKIYFQTAPGQYQRIARLEDTELEARRVLRVTTFVEQAKIRPTFFTMEKQLPRLEIVDINADNRLDLVTIQRDILTVYLQDEKGMFPIEKRDRKIVPTLKSTDKEGAVEVSAIYFTKLDDDPYPEFIVIKTEGELGMIESIRTNVYIHKGNGTAAYTGDSTIPIAGVTLNPTFIDMNRDGKKDLMATEISTSIFKKILEFGLGDTEFNTRIWRFEGNHIKNEPDYTHVEFVAFRDIKEKGIEGMPIAYVPGDLSGDGLPDLLVAKPDNSLIVLRGRQGHLGFKGIEFVKVSEQPPIRLYRYPKYIGFFDVNQDNIVDVQVYYRGAVGMVLSKKK